MIFRWAMVLLLAAIVSPARAQSTTSGFDLAKALLDRTVRATGKRTLALPGEAGYGIIAGERRTPGGETELIIVVPDHLVRDPARPNAVFAAPIVSFRAEPTKGIFARLLDQRLAPADGDLAVLAVPKPADMALAPMPTAALDLISAGAPVWATARGGEWSPQPQAGRVAPRGRSMWMNVEGLINAADASGAAIVDQRGLAAMVLGPTQLDRAITQTLPIDVIAARLRAWNLPWDTGAAQAAVAKGPAPATPPADAQALPGLVMLLPAEVAARRSWTPAGTRASPWMDSPIRLFGAPRRAAPQLGMLPPGSNLPSRVLMNGAYDVIDKLDSGAWFLLGVEGRPVGYAAGNDLVEIWPMPQTTGLTGGKVTREWTPAAGKVALLRDVGNAFELETAVTCKAEFCDTILVFTPAPPAEGAAMPTYQAPPLTGRWQKNDVVALRLQLPRRIVEIAGTRLFACIGRDTDCTIETLLPPPAK